MILYPLPERFLVANGATNELWDFRPIRNETCRLSGWKRRETKLEIAEEVGVKSFLTMFHYLVAIEEIVLWVTVNKLSLRVMSSKVLASQTETHIHSRFRVSYWVVVKICLFLIDQTCSNDEILMKTEGSNFYRAMVYPYLTLLRSNALTYRYLIRYESTWYREQTSHV